MKTEMAGLEAELQAIDLWDRSFVESQQPAEIEKDDRNVRFFPRLQIIVRSKDPLGEPNPIMPNREESRRGAASVCEDGEVWTSPASFTSDLRHWRRRERFPQCASVFETGATRQ
jgi:hypothetical protein